MVFLGSRFNALMFFPTKSKSETKRVHGYRYSALVEFPSRSFSLSYLFIGGRNGVIGPLEDVLNGGGKGGGKEELIFQPHNNNIITPFFA